MTVDNTVVCLSWSPPLEGRQNGVIISYTISCSINSNSISQEVKGHLRGYCVDYRLGGWLFSCSIFASTSAGDGPSTNTIDVTTEGKATVCGFIQLIA